MKRKISAICTDIDGTLLDSNRQLSPKTISTVKKLNHQIPFILASSRMPSAMTHLQAELGILYSPLICYNGGYVLQYQESVSHPVVYDSVVIPVEIVAGIAAIAKATQIHISLYNEDNWYAPQFDYWAEREARVTKVNPTIESLPSVIERWTSLKTGAHKVMCMGPEEEIHAMEGALHQAYGNDLHVYRSRSTYIEIAPRKISKGTALEMIIRKLYNQSLDNVIAFGDNYNDIDMLRVAGLGIAVSNGRDEAKAVAKDITAPSIDDGVALAIEKYCL